MKKYFRPFLNAVGYYAIKAKWRRYQYLSRLQREDKKRNAEVYRRISMIDSRILPQLQEERNVTVSLTSHSTRVERFAPYAIYSILQQTVLPNRIVLNIDKTKWNKENLPDLIKKLQIAGLEVNLCEDVGPHTKLLPALQKYPDDVIITVDDDICYSQTAIEELLNAYQLYPQGTIVCRRGVEVAYENDMILPYSQWKETKTNTKNRISPFGVNGVLYPPYIFSQEIHNKDVYRQYCKCADDIWFTIMEIRENILVKLVSEPSFTKDLCVNHYNEYVAQNSDALHFQNEGNGMNNVQLNQLVEYYSLCGDKSK